MYLRLGFSVAMHIQPDILLLDEVLAVGDEAFQQKCQGRIWDFKRAGGTIVFVSHDASSVERLCDRAMLLEKGRVAASGTPEEVLRAYHRHLAARAPVYVDRPETAAPAGDVQILGLRAVAGDLTIRSRFIEGEPVVLETTVLAATGAESVQFTLSFRDTAGQLVAARTHPAVALARRHPRGAAPAPRDAAVPRRRLSHRPRRHQPRRRQDPGRAGAGARAVDLLRTSRAPVVRCGSSGAGRSRSARRRWNAEQGLQPGAPDGVPAAASPPRNGGPGRPAPRPAAGCRAAARAWRGTRGHRRTRALRPIAATGRPARRRRRSRASGAHGSRPRARRSRGSRTARRSSTTAAPAMASCFICSST